MAIDKQTYMKAKKKALGTFAKAGIVLRDHEKENIEIADFGLNDLETTGLQLVSYVLTDRCSAKELVLFPRQTCPEHRHPPINRDNPGKEETFRCRWGEVYLYVEGEPTKPIRAVVPKAGGQYYTCRHEIVLTPGDQYTMKPNTRHWFQGGPKGAVVSEFSTKNIDEEDIFTDPAIKRAPEVKED